MKAIEFEHQNTVFAENQEEYENLPALVLHTRDGEVITCWHLSLKERLRVLFLGRVWMCLLSFHKPIPPAKLATNNRELYRYPIYKIKWYIKIWRRLKKFFTI
jgi:hypothetical protein